MNFKLIIQEKNFKEIVCFCEEGYPKEVCGVLLGKIEEAQQRVQKIVPTKNLNQERANNRYEMDPNNLRVADELARKDGLEIAGFYHSHPDHPAQASKTDTEKAWEGYSYLILAIREGKLDSFKCWRLNKGEMVEETVEVIHG